MKKVSNSKSYGKNTRYYTGTQKPMKASLKSLKRDLVLGKWENISKKYGKVPKHSN